jgi:hypothetical protein
MVVFDKALVDVRELQSGSTKTGKKRRQDPQRKGSPDSRFLLSVEATLSALPRRFVVQARSGSGRVYQTDRIQAVHSWD